MKVQDLDKDLADLKMSLKHAQDEFDDLGGRIANIDEEEEKLEKAKQLIAKLR